MVLDSDDDGPAADGVPSIADFDVHNEESDSSEPYLKIIRHIDIPCGTCVRHISTPHLPTHIWDSPPGAFPPIFLSNIVVAAACNDNSIRLITLPLLPPQPSIDGTSYKAVQTVTIAGISTHQEVPSGIAVTHSAVSDAADSRPDSSKSRSRSGSRVAAEENKGMRSDQSGRSWCLLLVSTSATAGGLLLTHQMPLVADTQFGSTTEDLHPIQRCYLRFSCLSSKVVFNPSAFPADRHSTILVSAADACCVKVYQVSPESRSNLSRSRRNSAATTDSLSSGLRTSSGSVISNGRFLITLYPGFTHPSSSSSLQRRKRILDVAWVASGRAIIALLEDGEWGVWDLEGAGPGSGPANLLRGQSNTSSIHGGSLTKFKIGGRIMPVTETVSKIQNTELRDTKDRRLVPMTPHTRKMRSVGLFRDGDSSFRTENDSAQFIRGHICVTEHAPSTASSLSNTEESLVIAHGSSFTHITSLQALWRAETSSKGTFDSIEAIRPSPILGVTISHERLIDIAELPHSPFAKSKLPFGAKSNEAADLLVVGDHRLTFFVSRQSEQTSAEGADAPFPLRLGKAKEPALGKRIDQALLGKGQLDLEGMDRILEGMGHENTTVSGQGGLFGKNVAFDMDEDGDMSMTSPTPKAGGRSKRTPGRSIGRRKGGTSS